MAKGKNMMGKFRGKVGAMVFRTEAGLGQIASEYNPNPKNPRTVAQTKQRNKMNLAGQISKTVTKSMLIGFGSDGRSNRSEFVSNLIKVVRESYQAGTNGFRAMIDAPNIKFAKGAYLAHTANVAYNNTSGKLTVTYTNNSNEALVGLRVIVMVTEHNTYKYATMATSATVLDNAVTVEFTIPAIAPSEDSEHSAVHVYAIPLVDNGSEAMTTFREEVQNAIELEGGAITDGSTFTAIADRAIKAQSGLFESQYLGEAAIDAE